MSKVEAFLSTEEEQDIIEAIQNAEKNTSGEIRVHIEQSSKADAYKRAVEVFHSLKMNETKLRNGVLIYVAVADKTFAIYGDDGINAVVADNFWKTTRDTIQQHFKSGNFKQGLVEGIKEAGAQLKTYFPWQQDDTNELSNEISKG
jgi:uncharacterized membrane protein